MNSDTRRRAERAIRFIKLLAHAHSTGSEIRLPGGKVFSCRAYDDCFEAGDGTEVVVLIMQAARTDAELRSALSTGLAADYVCPDAWAKVLADWEARQTAELPFEIAG